MVMFYAYEYTRVKSGVIRVQHNVLVALYVKITASEQLGLFSI